MAKPSEKAKKTQSSLFNGKINPGNEHTERKPSTYKTDMEKAEKRRAVEEYEAAKLSKDELDWY